MNAARGCSILGLCAPCARCGLGPRSGELSRFGRRAHPHVSDLHRLLRWLAVRTDLMASENRADRRVQAFLGEPLAGCFGLPDVQVAQMTIVHHLREMHEESFRRLIAESGDDLVIDIHGDWYVLHKGVSHGQSPFEFNPNTLRMNCSYTTPCGAVR